MRSGVSIDSVRCIGYFLSKIRGKAIWGANVYLAPTKQRRKLSRNARNGEVARRPPRLELDQHVNIAVGREILAQHGAKERQRANVIPPADCGNLFLRYRNLWCGLDLFRHYAFAYLQ